MANRRKQIEAIQDKAAKFSEEIELLVEELEEAFENMPDSFRYGERGESAYARIEMLETWVDRLDEIVQEAIE